MDLFGEPDTPEKEEPIAEEDFTSEASALDSGLSHPRLMSQSFGHEQQQAKILEQFEAGRVPHGLIFTGPKGIGKATFAYRLARFLLSQQAADPNQDALFGGDDLPETDTGFDIAPDAQVFRQVASGGHPDLLTVERAYDAGKDQYKDSVAVDDVRKVIPFLRMTASKEGGWRVVIVDDADTMNRNAQNAILKVLEEPPENTMLILICHRLGAMIPTIRSRTQLMQFDTLSQDHFRELLTIQGYNLEQEQFDTLYHLSEGSIGTALEYVEQGGLDTLTLTLTMFENWPHYSWTDIHVLADQLGSANAKNAYKSFTHLLPWMFAQMITAKARGREIASKVLHIEPMQKLYRQSSLESLLEICENLKTHFETVERSNLDKRQAVLSAFMIMESA